MHDEQTGLPDRRPAEIADISPRRLRSWESTDLVTSDVERVISPRNVVCLTHSIASFSRSTPIPNRQAAIGGSGWQVPPVWSVFGPREDAKRPKLMQTSES